MSKVDTPFPVPAGNPGPREPEAGNALPESGVALVRRSEIRAPRRPPAWLWEGYLGPKSITLLTGQWKCGKTTLLANLLGRLGGGGTLAGRSVRAGTALVLAEEGPEPWLERMERHEIGDAITFGFHFHARESGQLEWLRLMDDLFDLWHRRPMDLLVLDSLAAILPPGAEGNAGVMTELLQPVRQLARLGASVLLAHHPRKGSAGYGQKARGTGALPAAVDIVLEFDWAGPRTAENRRRMLRGWSRHTTTPPQLLLELNPEGTDYAVLPDPDPDPAGPAAGPCRVLTDLLRDPEGRTLREVLAVWPHGEAAPSERTLLRWLSELVDAGWLVRSGRGDRFDPYRYRVG
ncbi:MAG TPA: AAA family ATPase [Gemmataceae bacterium]|nr:AAA family ATPase [Gemmataceae bacterium]